MCGFWCMSGQLLLPPTPHPPTPPLSTISFQWSSGAAVAAVYCGLFDRRDTALGVLSVIVYCLGWLSGAVVVMCCVYMKQGKLTINNNKKNILALEWMHAQNAWCTTIEHICTFVFQCGTLFLPFLHFLPDLPFAPSSIVVPCLVDCLVFSESASCCSLTLDAYSKV